MVLCEQRDLQKHALEKANSIITQLKNFFEQCQQSKQALTSQEAYKSYKTLSLEDKIRCLIKEEDIKQIESGIAKFNPKIIAETRSIEDNKLDKGLF